MKTCRFIAAALLSLAACLGSVLADDWPGFRGPGGSGVSAEKDLPVQWKAENFLWKVKLPGPGASSPITAGDRVFVTCYTGYGTTISKGMGGGGFAKGKGGFDKGGFGKGGFGKGGFGKGGGADSAEQKKLRRSLLCLDSKTGKVLWQQEVEPKLPEAGLADFIREHGFATNTPVTDGERVYVFFGKTGVLAFDLSGKRLWQTSVGTDFHSWGTAASPVLYKDLVIVNAALESKSLVALDKKTGKEVWRTRGIGSSWGAPALVTTKDGKQELVLNLPSRIVGYDPDTGKELWHCQGISSGGGMGGGAGGGGGFGGFGGYGGTYSTPVAKDGVVYVTGGGGAGASQSAIAVKAGGRGDVNRTHVVWRQRAGTQYNCPLVVGDHLYCIDGTVQCLRLDTGKSVYKERLYEARGEYVSAVAAGDKVYMLTRFDGVYVFSAGPKFERLAHNTFSGDNSVFNASPAVSNGRLYIRSNEYLYCVGKK